jgi:hypothetical protein
MAAAALFVGRVSQPMEAAISSGNVLAKSTSSLRDFLCGTCCDDSGQMVILKGSFYSCASRKKKRLTEQKNAHVSLGTFDTGLGIFYSRTTETPTSAGSYPRSTIKTGLGWPLIETVANCFAVTLAELYGIGINS